MPSKPHNQHSQEPWPALQGSSGHGYPEDRGHSEDTGHSENTDCSEDTALAAGNSGHNTNSHKINSRATSSPVIEKLIDHAKAGDESSLGQLLSSQQQYLTLMARVQVGRHLQGKIDASDIVQETFLQAHRSFKSFEGTAEPQFASWLKSILAHTMANAVRRFLGTQARDARLERQIAADIDQSALSIGGMLVDPGSSPSQHVVRSEQTKLVIAALNRLPKDYETVLVLRHLEGLSFPQVAERMGRSLDSVEKLWVRGLAKLKKEFVGNSIH